MSVHAFEASAGVRLGVRLTCIIAGGVGIAVGVCVLVLYGVRPGLFALIVGTPILVGLAGAAATIIVSPLTARDLRRQIAAEEAEQRAALGAEILITDAVARYFHPVPALHVPIGPGEITAYGSGYLAFESAAGGLYRSRELDGWRQEAEDEFVLECSPLYVITVHTRHAPEWGEWLTRFHGHDETNLVIDLATVEQQPEPENTAEAGAAAEG
jgi:hypothetical protein